MQLVTKSTRSLARSKGCPAFLFLTASGSGLWCGRAGFPLRSRSAQFPASRVPALSLVVREAAPPVQVSRPSQQQAGHSSCYLPRHRSGPQSFVSCLSAARPVATAQAAFRLSMCLTKAGPFFSPRLKATKNGLQPHPKKGGAFSYFLAHLTFLVTFSNLNIC